MVLSSPSVTGRRFPAAHRGEDPISSNDYGETMQKIFDGKKTAKLGTEANPAVVTVQTEKRVKALKSIFEEHNWNHTITVDPDKPEDIQDLDILLNPLKTRISEKTVGRNEPCPCGSGKKYKKCCDK